MTEATPAPGPAQRVQRTAGQLGGVSVLLTLAIEFDWFGAGQWTPGQSAAVFAAIGVLASAVQNLVGHLRKPREFAPAKPDPTLVDETRSVRANFAGNAVQDLPAKPAPRKRK